MEGRIWNPLTRRGCWMEAWGGYRVVAQDLVVHPRSIWAEHGGERRGEPRLKALIRIWSFNNLPPGLNSTDRRKFIARREMKAVAHLAALGSGLLERGAILRHIGDGGDEILTQHFELRELLQGWTTLDRFLVRMGEDFDESERLLTATTLLSLVAERFCTKRIERQELDCVRAAKLDFVLDVTRAPSWPHCRART